MMQVRKKKTTKPRAALKKPALKARTAKSKRGAPEKEQRKRADAANHTSKSRVQAPVAMKAGEAPTAIALPERKAQEFPVLWPALAMMRMWLGPRKSTRT